MVQRLGHYDGMIKNDWKHLRCGYGEGCACKMDRENAVVLERVGKGRIMLELINKRKRNWLGHWLRRNCLLKDALEGMVNGKKVRGRRYQLIDKIMINGLYPRQKEETIRLIWICCTCSTKTVRFRTRVHIQNVIFLVPAMSPRSFVMEISEQSVCIYSVSQIYVYTLWNVISQQRNETEI